MRRTLFYKSLFIVGVVIVCLLAVTGIPKGLGWQAWKTSIAGNIHLGLDLQGGTYLILKVNVDEAVAAETNQAQQRLQAALASKGIPYTSIRQPDPVKRPAVIDVEGIPPTRSGDFRTVLEDTTIVGPNYDVRPTSNGNYELVLNSATTSQIKDHALTQSIETIGNRVNELGVTEPTVQQHGLGDYEILVELPGVTDPDRVKQIMQETAQLQFRLGEGGPFSSEAQARAQYGGVLPEDSQILPGRNIGGASSSSSATDWYVVSRSSVVSGQDLRDAQPTTDNNGQMEVSFNLTRAAGQRFGDFTAANINKPLAIVLDNQVQEYANIQARIEDSGRITGTFSRQQASDLALILRSGALPASISYQQDEEVGPSLGADSIHAGIIAALTGFLLVAGFMLFYYHGAGINAVLALVLNLVILMAYMSLVSATLTLPGIAGIILTIGMAVDSNVLIFERIREEMRHGKSVPASVDIGFRQAFITILDTHVTTVVSAIFLFLFGTGPIKGFAVTLTVGLIANLFTAVFVSRVIFDYVLMRQQGIRGAKLSIG